MMEGQGIFDENFEAFASSLETVTSGDAALLRDRKATQRRGGVLAVVEKETKQRFGMSRWAWAAAEREKGRTAPMAEVEQAHAVLRSVSGYGASPCKGLGFSKEDRALGCAIASSVPSAFARCEATRLLTVDLAVAYNGPPGSVGEKVLGGRLRHSRRRDRMVPVRSIIIAPLKPPATVHHQPAGGFFVLRLAPTAAGSDDLHAGPETARLST